MQRKSESQFRRRDSFRWHLNLRALKSDFLVLFYSTKSVTFLDFSILFLYT